MFKRANKITSLLVAAAAVMSLVPAYAADVKKIDSEDGTVYNAVAYKDGKALIDGEVEDNDAAYYYADGKYTELSDVNSGSNYAAYGSKYVNVEDGDYFVDLTNGSVTDDSMDEDDTDDAATGLRKKLKDVDRYGNNAANILPDLKLISGPKFADSWYEVDTEKQHYTIDSKYAGNGSAEVAGAGTLVPNIYTDKDGNYIDADYNLGKIKVETTTGSSATIENTVDKEDLTVNDTASYTYAEVSDAKTLGQDKDYIYRYAKITVTVHGATNDTIKVNNKKFTLDGDSITFPVIQKISKAQNSDDIEEAKYAKTVYNYMFSNDDADNVAIGTDGGTIDGNVKSFYDLASDSDTKATVVGGKLVLYNVLNAADADSTRGDTVLVQAATLKQENGYYYTDIEDDANISPEYNDDLNKTAFDTDVDGNIYVLDEGYVKEFDGTDDWTKIYKVDGSFDGLSVYDKDNMVSWSQDDEVYSVIGAKTTDDSTGTTTAPAVTAGWAQATDGTWSYNKADGTKATGWFKDTNGAWYFLKADGVMATGWFKDTDGSWYFLNASGAMATGWVNDGGAWYYLSSTGAMLANTTTPDGYFIGANGAWVK